MDKCQHREELNGDCLESAVRWFLLKPSWLETPILVGLCEAHISDALDLSCPELTREEASVWKVQES